MAPPARIAIGAAAAIGAIPWAALAAIAFLHAPWGASRLTRAVEDRASSTLQGTVRIGALRLGSLGELAARRLLILDPEGRPAAAIASAELRIDSAALLRGTLRVEALRLEGVHVELAPSPGGGLALGRALRPVQPAPKAEARPDEPLPPAPPLPIELADLHVCGSLRVARRPGGPPTLLVRDVDLDATGAWRGHDARVSLTATGDAAVPLDRPLALGAVARFADGVLAVPSLDLRLGGTRLFAEGSGLVRERIAKLGLHGRIEAEAARRLGIAIARDLDFEGSARQRGSRTEADLAASTAGGGTLHVAGRFDAETTGAEVRTRLGGVDPSRWVVGAPEGSLDGDASAEGRVEPLDLRVSAHLGRGRLEGEPLGPMDLDGRVRRGEAGRPRVDVDALRAALPGASIEGRGRWAPPDVEGRVEVGLRDLEELRAWLSRAIGLRLPPLAGEGTIEVEARSVPGDLLLEARADLPRLRVADAAAKGVRLVGSAAVAGGAWPAGEARVEASSLRFREMEFDEITLRARRDRGGVFRIRLGTAAPSAGRAGAALHADGIARPGFWKVDLGRASLRSGEVDLEARGDAVATEGRATGRIEAAAGQVGIVRASYDGPDDPLHAGGAAPLRLEVVASPVDLGGLSRILERPLPAGRVRARLVAAGTLEAPELELDGRGTGLWFAQAPSVEPFDVRVLARHHADGGESRRGHLEIAVDAWSGDRRIAEIAASAPVDLRALRAAPRAELDRVATSPRTRVAGELRGIDLAILGESVGRPGLHGAAAATLDLRGPLRDPRGRIAAELRGGPLGPVRDVHAAAAAELGDASVKVSATVDSEEAEAARARASVEIGASLAVLLDGRVDPATPVAAAIELHRIDLEDLTSDRSEADGRLAGVVFGSASFSGTVAAPCGDGILHARRLGVRGARFGDLEVSLALDATRLQARLHAFEEGGGTLAAGVELGDRWFERLASGDAAAIAALPAKVGLEAERMSLAPLGRALSRSHLAGILDASVKGEGRLADLRPLGAISIGEGAVQIPGGAMYERIAARVNLREDTIELRALDVHGSEGGRFFASGRIGGPGARPFATVMETLLPLASGTATAPVPFDLDLRADGIPVTGSGGPLARLTMRDRLEGRIGPGDGVTATLTIASAEVELPPQPPRTLQPLGPLPDVVFVPGAAQAAAPPGERKGALPFSLHVAAPRDVFVRGPNVELELQVDLFVVRDRNGALAATGYARTRRGEAEVAGRTFVVEHGEVRWIGGPPRNPHVDVTARYDAPQATAWADIGGTIQDPTVQLRSEPPLSESQIVMLIVAGRTQNPGMEPLAGQRREGQAGQGAAASLAGAAVTQKLREALGARVPVQILTSQTATGQTVVEAGTYVGRNLYVGFVRNFLAEPGENTNEVHAQYDLSRTVGLRTRFGDAGAGGVDVIWEKQIATPAQQRARKRAPPPRPPHEPEGETPLESAPPD
ncbi:MAG TPA: translocation/assembly module TamB domain-containing protein [Vulgatibacter sp.]|nr:translocation/assembly module TamB domain-containing protein [Vulgatibacter sp.]